MEIRINFARFEKDELRPDQDWVTTPDFMTSAALSETILKKNEKIIIDWTKPSDINVEKMILMDEFYAKPYEYTEEYISDSIHELFSSLETKTRTTEQLKEETELIYRHVRFYYSDNTWQDFYLSSCGKYLTRRYAIEGKWVTHSTYYIGEAQTNMIYDAIYSLPTDERTLTSFICN